VPGFRTFVLNQLPPPPRRVLEVGCGEKGGLVAKLRDAGYDALGVDPEAPEGEHFRRIDFREVDGSFDAVVAGRVLHHVNPLDDAVAKLAQLAPLLIVDEFAPDLIDEAAQDWYEGQHRMLAAAGVVSEYAPASIDEWRERHPDLHPHATLLDALRAHYEELTLEWVPYLHRWLRGPSSAALEQTLVDVGAFPAIGYRWAGVVRHS
jgi:SAM-dependent methyltransferase